jgi:tRNA-specific 2-thiouridylase
VPSNTRHQAYVVVEKRIHSNELIVAFDRLDTEQLYARCCKIGNISYTNRLLPANARIAARPRYRAKAATVAFEACGEGTAILRFDEPQRAITPGQTCALYDGETLLGGGIFEEVYN